MKKIFIELFFAILASIFGAAYAKNEIESIDDNPYAVATYLSNNINVLNEISNELGYEENITGVNEICQITIFDINKTSTGYFVDFYNDEGFFVIGDDFTFYDWISGQESPYVNVKLFDSICYSTVSGYLYELDGVYYSTDESNNKYEVFEAGLEHYNGQVEGQTGCGMIYNTDLYIEDKYGEGYNIISENTLNYTAAGTQMDFSSYWYIFENGSYSSEGNCGLIAAYNALQCWQQNSLSELPSVSTLYNYQAIYGEANIYNNYIYEGSNYIDHTINGISWPRLYVLARGESIFLYNKVEGLTIYQSANIIEHISAAFGYETNCQTHLIWAAYTNDVTNNIDNGTPSLWSTATDTYTNHTMAVCGYKYYRRTRKVWYGTVSTTVLFFEINDGWATWSRYYDVTRHNGSSAIVTMEVS